jgi:hypothetical protein
MIYQFTFSIVLMGLCERFDKFNMTFIYVKRYSGSVQTRMKFSS